MMIMIVSLIGLGKKTSTKKGKVTQMVSHSGDDWMKKVPSSQQGPKSREPEMSWQGQVAMLVSQAMQAGILMWNKHDMTNMDPVIVSEVMTGVTKRYASEICELAQRSLGTKSS